MIRKRQRQLWFVLVTCLIIVFACGCKSDKMEFELYTSDIQKAMNGSVIEVPFVARFSTLGKDAEGLISKGKRVVKKYINNDAEFKMSEDQWGDVMVIKCTVPIGTPNALKKYLSKHHRPIAL